jgi:DNA-binding transcriptional ArsR family regulator
MITIGDESDRAVDRVAIRRGIRDSFERLLWWLFAASPGAGTRKLVLSSIRENPRNAQQLSQDLRLDYTTVRHHLRVLETNNLVVAEGEKYGRMYFVSEAMESRWDKFETINESKTPSKERAGV